ncbi:MAG TPA: hypothetical protein VEC16_02555 [Alphaproteobacteria bacterium]|nr:hypothetical protein [Alphaproteobacteria bacterium]
MARTKMDLKKRQVVLKPELLDESRNLSKLEASLKKQNIILYVDRMLLFTEYHFEVFESGSFPNGYTKEGTIRYKAGHLRFPFGVHLPAYTQEEFNAKKRPRGIVTINEVVAAPLKKLWGIEASKSGFNNRESMIYEMTEWEDRFYKDMTPDSLVSYYHFTFNGNAKKKEIDTLLKIVQPPEPRGY